jgi:hypothetical protein
MISLIFCALPVFGWGITVQASSEAACCAVVQTQANHNNTKPKSCVPQDAAKKFRGETIGKLDT